MTSVFSSQNSISLCPTSFCTPRPNLPVVPGISFAGHLLGVLVLEGIVGLYRTIQLQLLQHYWSILTLGLDLDYCDIEWLALEINRNHSVIFEIVSKYCISDSFVEYEGYSISSKESLPTLVDIMVIWINSPILVHFSSLIPKMVVFIVAISCLTTCTSIYGPNVPGSYAILFFTASDFTFTTRNIHNWVFFLLWPSHFIPSGAICNCPLLFPSSI